MIGREVLITTKGFTKDELFEYLKSKWDIEQFPEPIIGKPTAASLDEYILLPASTRFMVIIYPKKAGGLFNKKNKVVLSVCDSPEGARDRLVSSINTRNIIVGAFQIGTVMSVEQERKGPAQDSLLKYTDFVKGILKADGILSE